MPQSRFAALSVLVIAATPLLFPPAVHAQVEPLVEQVRTAIDRGVLFLRRVEGGRGHWETGFLATDKPGGATSLAMLALLNSGVPPDDPMIRRGLSYLRGQTYKHVYVVGLQTMVFAEIGDPGDLERIQRNVDYLWKVRQLSGNQLTGWAYDDRGGIPDNSNAQYALLGLHAGRQAGARLDRAAWEAIREFYRGTQVKNVIGEVGGWSYHPERARLGGGRVPTLTMTIAGLCGLQICAQELNASRQGLQPDGTARFCGQYEDDDAIRLAHRWLEGGGRGGAGPRFRFDDLYTYYNCYGIERAGRLTGQRFLAGRDWYREGCEYLIALQREDGSWSTDKVPAAVFTPIVNTSLSLLFLSKGRTPVLISKWAYGPTESPGWNNKHFDAKNLVEFASKELFKRQPLAWQAYDARKINLRSKEDRLREVGTLLQSPIVYINGHDAPQMTPSQRQILKQYIEEGGFVLAEACCGSQRFAQGFRDLMAQPDMFPDNPVRLLPPEHPIWKSWALVRPDLTPLEGIELGCKTVVVLSPKPLAGYWEENQFRDGTGREAFRLAGNVIAYATGLEAPKPRGTEGVVFDPRNERQAPRGFFQVAQLQHGGDWQPAPRAMQNLMAHLRTNEKLDVALLTEALNFTDPNLFKYKFVYLHGRGPFQVPAEGLTNLRTHLTNGAVLFADSCCGSAAFDAAFRTFAAQLFPGAKLEAIPVSDELYSADLNGAKIETVKIRTGGAGAGFDPQPPTLEGIKVDGRWAVIYSKYDIGCALEKHQSGDCKGHDHDSAIKLASAAVLYCLKK